MNQLLTHPPYATSPLGAQPAGGMCGGAMWMAYWYAWQRAQALAAAPKAVTFDPSWN